LIDVACRPFNSSQAPEAFARDSQHGTLFARDQTDHGNVQPLSKEQTARGYAALACHPTIQSPELVLPGTIEG
jgi:hypothetical protein